MSTSMPSGLAPHTPYLRRSRGLGKRTLHCALLLALALALAPGRSGASGEPAADPQPAASVAKLLTYSLCAAGVIASATTGVLLVAAIACFRVVADEVEKVTR